jgi:hypothetical protein
MCTFFTTYSFDNFRRNWLLAVIHPFTYDSVLDYCEISVSSIGANAELTQETYNLIESLEAVKARQARLGISSVLFLLCFAGLLLIYRKKYLH